MAAHREKRLALLTSEWATLSAFRTMESNSSNFTLPEPSMSIHLKRAKKLVISEPFNFSLKILANRTISSSVAFSTVCDFSATFLSRRLRDSSRSRSFSASRACCSFLRARWAGVSSLDWPIRRNRLSSPASMKPDAFSSSFFQSARSCVWLRCFSFRPSWWRTKTSSSLNEMRRLPSMSILLKSVKKLRKSGSLPLSASLNFLDSDTTSSSLSSSAKATRAIISRPLSLSYSALASSASNRLRSLCSSILASDAARVNSRFALALS